MEDSNKRVTFVIPKNYKRDLYIFSFSLRNAAEALIISLLLGWLVLQIPMSSQPIRITLICVVCVLTFFLLSQGKRKDSPTQYMYAVILFMQRRRKLVYRRDFRDPDNFKKRK